MEYVTITKYWNNPKIFHTVDSGGLSLRVSLEDFTAAILEEFGSPTTTVTKNQMKNKLTSSVSTVIERLKEETIKTHHVPEQKELEL